MNLADTIRKLWRRWYIVLPGLFLALGVGMGCWLFVPPGYERMASVLLLPGRGVIPEQSPNPYLFLGSLTAPADALVRAVSSETGLSDLTEANPGIELEIARDLTTPGPVINIIVTARSDQAAESVVREMTDRTASKLERLQTDEGVAPQHRMTMVVLAIDEESTIKQRDRLVLTVGSAGAVGFLTLFAASAAEGFAAGASVPRRGSRQDEAGASSKARMAQTDAK